MNRANAIERVVELLPYGIDIGVVDDEPNKIIIFWGDE